MNYSKIIFLNQRSGVFFQELARDISCRWHPSEIWTEIIGEFRSDECLTFVRSPGYKRNSHFTRLFSWMSYFIYVWFKLLFRSSQSLLFIVSMPPFLGVAGYLLKKLRGQRYVVLVFDIHPDLLMRTGGLKNTWVIKLWRKMNSVVLSHADAVITIGEYMAKNLKNQFNVNKTILGRVAVMPIWADTEWLKPMAKESNPFIQEHRFDEKFIVMYSGNIGATHDIETLIEAAKRFRDCSEIQFVVIGDGAKKQYVLDCQKEFALHNLTVLPYVPQEQLPFSLSAADIAIVSMEEGTEGYLIPSRIFSSMAAGNAVIAACGAACELADIVRDNKCGIVVRPKDADAMVSAIEACYQDRQLLKEMKSNSRQAAMRKYSRNNAKRYIELLENLSDKRQGQIL